MKKLLAGSLFLALLGVAPFTLPEAHAQIVVRVGIAPPAPRVEYRTVAPSPRHIWVGGHWGWQGGRHVWSPGIWQVPPRPGNAWIPARWVNIGGQWEYQPGRWGGPGAVVVAPPVYAPPAQPVYAQPVYTQPAQPVYAQPAQPVYTQPAQPVYAQPDYGPDESYVVESAPPPPQQEMIPMAPSPQHVWVQGHWRWDPRMRRHAWYPGRYIIRQSGMVWVPAGWRQHGWRHQYVPGHWRRAY